MNGHPPGIRSGALGQATTQPTPILRSEHLDGSYRINLHLVGISPLIPVPAGTGRHDQMRPGILRQPLHLFGWSQRFNKKTREAAKRLGRGESCLPQHLLNALAKEAADGQLLAGYFNVPRIEGANLIQGHDKGAVNAQEIARR